MPLSSLTPEQLALYRKDGFVILRNFYARSEVCKLVASLSDQGTTMDQDSEFSIPWWKREETDLLTGFTHHEKLVTSMDAIFGCNSPVCHIDTKTIEKQPQTGGCWAWHQDFAHWQAERLLFADQVAGFVIALTPINKRNGCSQVIRGSHKLGRLDHGFGETERQPGAAPEMVNLALESMEIVDIELGAGDALFFHSNLLHRGRVNESPESSWIVVASYATEENLSTNDTYAAWQLPIIPITNDEFSSKTDWRTVNISWDERTSILKDLAARQLLYAS